MMFFLLIFIACSETPAEKTVEIETVADHQQGCTAEARANRPDVFIVSVDTLRADRFGFTGHQNARTPNIDALAARGQHHSQATTPVPRTTPALASLLTGLEPHHHGVREVGEVIQTDQTLARHLQSNGWRTVGVSAMQVAGPDQGLDHGFDTFEVHHDSAADKLTAHALERVGQVPEQCPLMLWIHFSDPHFPYLPRKRWADQPQAQGCRSLGEKAAKGKLARYRLFSDRNGMASKVLDECSSLYDAEIAFTDHAIGDLLKGLSNAGRDNAIVVFTADHGESMGEWDLFFEHGPNVHDSSLRIPLLMSGPGVPVGQTNAVARLEDVVPTILDLLPTEKPSAMASDGRSLTAAWDGSDTVPWALAESGSALHARLGNYLVEGRKHRLHCIHGEQYSLCNRPNQKAQLFDRSIDPDLRKNIIGQHPNEAKRLQMLWSQLPVERTRQRIVRSSQFSVVAKPVLEGGYAVSMYDHVNDPMLIQDVQKKHAETFTAMKSALDEWNTELDLANKPVEERTDEQEEALRSLGYIE